MKKSILLVVILSTVFGSGLAQFGSPTIIDSNFTVTLRNIITSDINNDALQDIVISDYTNRITWYKNIGGTFTAAQTISSTIINPFHLDCGDANGDGLQDILVTTGNQGRVYLLLNNNKGLSWTQIEIDSNISLGAFKSFFVDIENDGDLDIVTNGDVEITWYENLGNGVFSSPISIEQQDEYYSITINDFNGDGFSDLVVNTGMRGIILFENSTNGNFNSPVVIDSGVRIFLDSYDIDKDGDFDIIVGNSANTSELSFYTNNGSGSFLFSHNETDLDALDQTNSHLNFTDLNSDGHGDLLTVGTGNLEWRENDQTGLFINTILIDNSYDFRIVNSEDFDNDGDRDIVWFGLDPITFNLAIGTITNNNSLSSIEYVKETNSFVIYPNPATNSFTITGDKLVKDIQIFNSVGQLIKNAKSPTVDLTELNTGVYFVIIYTMDGKMFKANFIKKQKY